MLPLHSFNQRNKHVLKNSNIFKMTEFIFQEVWEPYLFQSATSQHFQFKKSSKSHKYSQ